MVISATNTMFQIGLPNIVNTVNFKLTLHIASLAWLQYIPFYFILSKDFCLLFCNCISSFSNIYYFSFFLLVFLLNQTEPNFWSGSGSVHQNLVWVRFSSSKQRFGSKVHGQVQNSI